MQSDRIQFLIDNLHEGLDVEVKNWLGGLKENAEKAKLAKEIIALANHGGGLIFIGFDEDSQGHLEIEPQKDDRDAFTQDSIASLVQRYLEPPCQCRIEVHKRSGSNIAHPVIVVPGKHRTPIWAKSGSPDGQKLQPGTVYVRRPGGYSEPCRSQDDWERLLDRLVKARQVEQLDAIRQILIPDTGQVIKHSPTLDTWDKESYAEWQNLLHALPPDSPYRFNSGHWTFSFSISPFRVPPLAELNEVLNREVPKYSGWPPFTYLQSDSMKPNALGDNIQAWLVDSREKPQSDPWRSDFWRISRKGFGYLLRPMQEDRPSFAQNIAPRPAGQFFDWTRPVYRTFELLKCLEKLAEKFSDANASFEILLKYYHTNGRRLINREWKYDLPSNLQCAMTTLESRLSRPVHAISTNIEELVHSLLVPIFEQFEFASLPKAVSDDVIREAKDF